MFNNPRFIIRNALELEHFPLMWDKVYVYSMFVVSIANSNKILGDTKSKYLKGFVRSREQK